MFKSIDRGFLPAPLKAAERSTLSPQHVSPALPSSSLIKGQVLEGRVLQSLPVLLLETSQLLLRAAPVDGLRVGERLLLEVIEPEMTPPRVRLVNETGLSDASRVWGERLLQSLLLRSDSLGPLRQWLTHRLSGANADQATPASRQLQQLFSLPSKPDADWVRYQLGASGLFHEAEGVARGAVSLKSLLLALLSNEPRTEALSAALESIVSTQVKALGAASQDGIGYQCLLPFVDQTPIELEIRQSAVQRENNQWHLLLKHKSEMMGRLEIDILLRDQRVCVCFWSDQAWLADLVNSHQGALVVALEAAGLTVERVSACKRQPGNPYQGHEVPAILDMKA